MQFWATPKKKKRTPKRDVWAKKKPAKKRPVAKRKSSIWVAKNPQYKKREKKSIWVSRSPKASGGAAPTPYRTTYQVYLLQGNRAKRVKTFRDPVEANSWVEDARVRTPYNNYKVQPVSRRKGLF